MNKFDRYSVVCKTLQAAVDGVIWMNFFNGKFIVMIDNPRRHYNTIFTNE